MKKILLILMLILTLSLSSCTAIKLNRFKEFAESEAMDIELYRNIDSDNSEKIMNLKFNKEIMIISIDGGKFIMDLVNDLVFVDYGGLSGYTEFDLSDYKDEESSEDDSSKYISNIESKEDWLSFELNINQMMIDKGSKTEEDEPVDNVICKVTFLDKKVSNIEMSTVEAKDDIQLTIRVNAYGDEVEGLEVPSKEDYSYNPLLSFVLTIIFSQLEDIL